MIPFCKNSWANGVVTCDACASCVPLVFQFFSTSGVGVQHLHFCGRCSSLVPVVFHFWGGCSTCVPVGGSWKIAVSFQQSILQTGGLVIPFCRNSSANGVVTCDACTSYVPVVFHFLGGCSTSCVLVLFHLCSCWRLLEKSREFPAIHSVDGGFGNSIL